MIIIVIIIVIITIIIIIICELEQTAVIALSYTESLACKSDSYVASFNKVTTSNIFNFCRKALILCLPNKSNLYRWIITEDN